ncbi:MAG: hypothetical protein ACOVRN_05430 [Flavobacterium sp.]
MEYKKQATIVLRNGIGDKLLDTLGFYVICKYLNYQPHVEFNRLVEKFEWGFGSTTEYDLKLFNFSDIIITNGVTCPYFVRSVNPSSTLCPYKVYMFLLKFIPGITFNEVSDCFVSDAKRIFKPSEVITSLIPDGIENAYGIHLRKTDKVIAVNGDLRHVATYAEFEIIIQRLLDDVNYISANEPDSVFFITSEDDDWLAEMKQRMNVRLISTPHIDDRNARSVLHMFCLSKCKMILQGVKYSSFSMIASILGAGKLRNYSNHLDSRDICLLPSWNSVVEINGKKCYDLEVHDRVTMGVTELYTNID